MTQDCLQMAQGRLQTVLDCLQMAQVTKWSGFWGHLVTRLADGPAPSADSYGPFRTAQVVRDVLDAADGRDGLAKMYAG